MFCSFSELIFILGCAQVQQGLLWVWPESGADAWLEAANTVPDTVADMVNPSYAGSQGGFAFMENPASLPIMLVRHPPARRQNKLCPAEACALRICWELIGAAVCRRMLWTPAMPHMCTIW